MHHLHADRSTFLPRKSPLLTSAVFALCSITSPALMAEELSFGAIDISGYLDMSISSVDTDGVGSDEVAGLDRAELRFNTQLDDKVSLQIHVAGGDESEYGLEQANITYQATDELSFFAGEYLSALGWEAFHAPDLFQYSVSAALVYPAFFSGAGAKYKTDGFEIYGSMASGIWDAPDADTRTDDIGWEAAVRFTAVENLTVFLGTATGAISEDADFDRTVVNLWASYVMGSLTLAAEYNDLTDFSFDGDDGDSWLVMANYAFNDAWGLTLRTSAIETDGGTDVEKFTVAGSYVLTDNISFVAEYNTSTDNATDADTDVLALEMIVVF